MRASELLVRCLEVEGVEYVFGVPGEEILDVLTALSTSSIRFIPTRHESGAAFMADAYGRLTGRAGVCLSTLGPGATNLLTGVADAQLDLAPLVALTGQTKLERIHKESHQYVDIVSVYRDATKWNGRVNRPDVIPEMVRKAFRLAQAEKPGATHLELPQDVAGMVVPDDLTPIEPREVRRAAPDREALRLAAAAINDAKSPVILAGSSAVRRPEAAVELRRFAHRFGIPVTHTFMAKGAMPDDDPLSLLPVGLPGGGDLCLSGICHADLIIAVGYDQVEYHAERWNPDRSKRILHIDYTHSEVDRSYTPEVEVVADIRETLELLAGLVRYRPSPVEERAVKTLGAIAARERRHGADDPSFPLKPQRIVHAMRGALRSGDILVSDVGAHKVWIAGVYPTYEPQTSLISNGYSSMGFGLPAAIAAKLVYPERRVMAAVGDGGLLMSLGELETAVRLGLAVTVVVWVDGGYGLIRWKQQSEGRPEFGVDFGNPDFVALARSFGMTGFAVTAPDDLPDALEAAFREPVPSLVAVPVDYREQWAPLERIEGARCPVPNGGCGRGFGGGYGVLQD